MMTNKEILSFLKPFIKQEKKGIVLAIVFSLLSSLIGMTYGYFSGLAMSKVAENAFQMGIFILLFNLFLSVLNYIFFERLSTLISNRLSFRVIERITFILFEKVLKLPTKAFEEKSSGEFINRITEDAGTITEAIGDLLYIAIKLLANFIIFLYILSNSIIVAIETILYLVLLYCISKKFNKKLKKLQKEIKTENDHFVSNVNEDIRGIREVRALGINENITKELNGVVKNLFHKRDKTITYETNYYVIMDSLGEIYMAITFITIIMEILWGSGSYAFLIAMTYYVYNFMNLVNRLARFSTQYQKLKVSVERIYEIVNNKLYQDVEYGSVHNLSLKGTIEFQNVSFHYHDNKENILSQFQLEVKENTSIAIIGKSGQGKSTIFNLLLRYFESTKGTILLDGIEIAKYDEESLRKNISIIRQDPFLFNKTIFENFKMVNSKITIKEVREYCKIALLDDYIMTLPKKYNTKIGEGGVNLSGGQKQRLAIARALSKNSKIILLDEATSALDNESQASIIKVMKRISKDHTIITIAHRLSTIIDSDSIHIMDEGRIIASGTHEELLKKNKIYQDLYKNNA